MSKTSIAHIFLEANPRSALTIDTAYGNKMFAQLASSLAKGRNGLTYQFFGRGQTVADALQALDADIVASGISVQTFAFPGHTQAALDAGRKKVFAEMRRQIAEEEAAAIAEARENAEHARDVMHLNLTGISGLAAASQVEQQAEALQ